MTTKRAGKNHKLPGGGRTPASRAEQRRRVAQDETGLNMTNINAPIIAGDGVPTPDPGCDSSSSSGGDAGGACDSGGGDGGGGGGDAG